MAARIDAAVDAVTLKILGRMNDEVRLPLVNVTASTTASIRAAMVHAGLING